MNKRNRMLLGGTLTVMATSLTALPVMSVDKSPFEAREIQRPADSDKKLPKLRVVRVVEIGRDTAVA